MVKPVSGMPRRSALATGAGGIVAALVPSTLLAEADLTFFRIATGGTAGTFYPVGALLATVISGPPGVPDCEEDGGSCVPGLLATALSSEGAVENIGSVVSGDVESGFSQSDVVYWAYTGTGIFAGSEPRQQLRLIGSLYPEVIHIVIRRDAGIASVPDLAGKRISLDVEGSGTLVAARIILESYGLGDADLDVRYIKHGPAVSMMRAGELDGLFVIAGYPANSVFDLVEEGIADLLPIPAEHALGLLVDHPFFSLSVVPEGSYPGLSHVTTLAIGVQWIVTQAAPDDLVYRVTRALWHPNNGEQLASGLPAARQMKLSNALLGAAVPLHPGAAAYYTEAGLDLSDVPVADFIPDQ
ncbi:MAG: TAXI family TRAP transporter solute-binding subunit [bacterium]|nr:TAXI family TRAP transporter solute-binding subunit [bacterium]MDE0417873.1 TAXI family TRAP transporter solute-binding subunit [bacterium]